MHTEHIGVVTGLPDLANFLAAANRYAPERDNAPRHLKSVLFGAKKSLPDKLQTEFVQIAKKAFPAIELFDAPIERISKRVFDGEGYEFPQGEKGVQRIVYGNALQKAFHISYYALLRPDEFVFFDNGLSSYWQHDINVTQVFQDHGLQPPAAAYLTLSPPLPPPPYLNSVKQFSLQADDYAPIFAAMRSAVSHPPVSGWLPQHVLIGTSLFRTNRISWEEERHAYLQIIIRLQQQGVSRILFKAHPRASERPLVTASDGVEILETPAPVEAFVKPGATGAAYSISSTSLFSLTSMFGWRCERIATPAANKVIDSLPHLGLARSILAFEMER